MPDWKDESGDPEGGLWGFEVTDPYGSCPYVYEGWTYAWYNEVEGDGIGELMMPSGEFY